MKAEEKIKQPYKRKLIIWASLNAILFAVCYFYHAYSGTDFSPVVSVSLILLISFISFSSLGLLEYFTDKSFSGKIIHYKAECRIHKISAFERRMETRLFVEMTVECDDGTTTMHEEMLSGALSKKIPYRDGDRVYHIKGAKYTCRFPRNDTEQKYEPISVICPLCGAILPLGTKTCSFCDNDLPYDPLIK